MRKKYPKASITNKIIIFILIIFLIIEFIPIIIGIIKLSQGDSNAWGYIIIPSLSIISTLIIMIPAIFIAKSYSRKAISEDEDDSKNTNLNK